MSIIAQTFRCDWPGCDATVTYHLESGQPTLNDLDWKGRNYDSRGNPLWHACPLHRFKSTEEFRAAIERDRGD